MHRGRSAMGCGMSRQSELLDRAAECQRLMDLSSDPKKKQTFRQLRDMWIELARESTSMPAQVLAERTSLVERLQAALNLKYTTIH